jgi:Cu/Zn superoxide dismutase
MRFASSGLVFALAALTLACEPPANNDAGPQDDDAGASDQDAGDEPQPLFDAGPPPEGQDWIAGGAFTAYPAFAGQGLYGSALIVRDGNGTKVSVQLSGVTANGQYMGHVHAYPCDVNNAGGHYKKDPTVEAAVAGNEIWMTISADANGEGWIEVTTEHVARPDGMSVVIHDTPNDNAKMVCADLKPTGPVANTAWGTFWPFAGAETVDDTIRGSASLLRTATGSTLDLEVHGLDPAATYASHVHAYPCDVNNAGGHYKLDPTVDAAEETNELWPTITPNAEGMATYQLTSTHVARPDAQSVVIHRVVGEDKPKVACSDLVREDRAYFQTSGSATLLTEGTNRFPTMTATAEMERNPAGTTTASITLGNLAATSEYPVHLHARPCAVGDGGGHYKIDPQVVDVVETNEVWLTLTTDATGAGTREVSANHVVRAGGQSMVVHDGADGARLACIDLVAP